MLDALKSLSENNAILEELLFLLNRHGTKRSTKTKCKLQQNFLKSLAPKYEHDKGVMVEALDKMVEENLLKNPGICRRSLNLLKQEQSTHVAMRENADPLKNFVVAQLGKEVSELHEDQKAMSEKFGKLEEFVVEALTKEIAEFHEDKKDLAETKVPLILEAKKHLDAVKESFVKKGAKVVQNTVAKTPTKEITQLKEDIDTARRNDFGRKLFETFAEEYTNSYLNEKRNCETIKSC